ncbi:hypothetical protein Trydic_g22796 [Trypoxylus dichotomus]
MEYATVNSARRHRDKDSKELHVKCNHPLHNHHYQFVNHLNHSRHHSPMYNQNNHQAAFVAALMTDSSSGSCADSSSRSSTEPIDTPISGSPKVEHCAASSPKQRHSHHHHHHHHHSIQELKRFFGKKVNNWISERGARRSSCSEDSSPKPDDEFRGRSKSLDGTIKRPIRDCESTYKIYDSILREASAHEEFSDASCRHVSPDHGTTSSEFYGRNNTIGMICFSMSFSSNVLYLRPKW